MPVIDRLQSLQLIVVTGKGGVGKSVVSAALAGILAGGGRRVMLLEVDPRENLHQLLDVEPSGGAVVEAAPHLWLQHLEPRTILDDLVEERLKVGMLARKVLSSPIHRHFTEGAPGLKEAAVFGRVLRLVEGHGPKGVPRPDTVILDAPATGHGVSWLAAPQLVADVISSGPIGQMAVEISAFLADPARFGVVVVTTAEEMPVQESVELLAELDGRFGRRPVAVIVNALYPPAPSRTSADPGIHLWQRRRAINQIQSGRLAKTWKGPIAEIPMFPIDPGPVLVGAVVHALERTLGGTRS
jgi:anion-transporting  ArsA/GET3 family ATPase